MIVPRYPPPRAAPRTQRAELHLTLTTRFKWEAIDFAEAQAGRPFVWLVERFALEDTHLAATSMALA
ncbi:MAG: hypothetical protein M3497_08460 [Gemmatimonadota bacterium]|nr:hypothetical protein [Gemmatimonadota bacterium]